MDIQHCRRILAVGAPGSGVLDVIKELTGSKPTPDVSGSTAGLIHEWTVRTAYYCANVPIWVDEILDVETWKAEFLRPEAKEVIDAVGAWLLCFRQLADGSICDTVASTLQAIQEVVEKASGGSSDVVMLAIAVPASGSTQEATAATLDIREDTCTSYGFEYIQFLATGSNEFGEKVGAERIREALEANEWASNDEGDEDSLNELYIDDDDDIFGGFSAEEAEMSSELFGMKEALIREDLAPETTDFALPDQAAEVDNLDQMMGRILAIKERSADLSEPQRKRLAAQAVKDLLK